MAVLAVSLLLAPGSPTTAAPAPPAAESVGTVASSAAEPAPRVVTEDGPGVTVDLGLLQGLQEGDTFMVELPDGAQEAVVEFRDDQRGFTGWSGSIGTGTFDAVAAAGDTPGSVRVEVTMPGAAYVIAPESGAGDGRTGPAGDYRIRDVSDVAVPPHVDDAVVPPSQLASAGAPPAARGTQAPRKVRLLVVYSKQAKKAAGGKKRIRARARTLVQQTNASFEKSQIGARIVLAGVKPTSGEKRKNVLGNLKSLWKRDGRYENVPRLRSRTKADLVHLLVKTRDRNRNCGQGYIAPTARYAYSVATQACSTRFRISSHEIGHNFGGDHDRRASAKPIAKRPARGHVNVRKGWITVMSYYTACEKKGKYCRVIPYFSNPKVKYNGSRTGIKGKADNARVIRGNAGRISRFR